MEEPVFIKVEPDIEESPYLEPDIDLHSGKSEEIKVEPCLEFDDDSSVEEETSEIVKEEHEVKVWKEEFNNENPTIVGNHSDDCQPAWFTSDEQAESNSRQKTTGRSSFSEVLGRTNCSASGGIFACEICDKTFEKKKYLKRHVLIHADQKPHVCTLCGRSFVRKEQLDCHVSTHRGVKLFICKVCGKQFGQRSSLERHGVLHTGSKPYSCKLCHRTFGDLSNFRRHTFLHSGQKPYVCDTCGKSFPTPSAVSRHQVTHIAVKCHNCETCGRLFATKGNLNRHKVIHVEDKPFACSTCGRAYRALFMLKRHMRKHKPRPSHASVSDNRTDDQSVTTANVP